MATYQLWDLDSGNIVAEFEDRRAALAAVRDALREHGERYVLALGLASADRLGRIRAVAAGGALVNLARRAAVAVKVPRAELSDALETILRQAGVTGWVREYPFASPRRFRFDFAWVEKRLAVECDGGTFTGGRHVRPAGFERDLEKINLAQIMGWTVLRFTFNMVADGRAVRTIEECLRAQAAIRGGLVEAPNVSDKEGGDERIGGMAVLGEEDR